MKKFIATLVLSLATVALFVGCQPQDSGGSGEPAAPEAPDTNAMSNTPEAP